LLQRLDESSHEILSFSIMSGEWGEHADAPHALALLRPHRKRPRRRRSAEQRDELAPLHSMTSSARASRVGATSMPSALAVLRLMINSKRVACSMGRSAGFVPFKTLSTSAIERRQMCG